ncbi:MAG: hypothetical protein ACJ72W_10145 [Actinoallomurus sp.]
MLPTPPRDNAVELLMEEVGDVEARAAELQALACRVDERSFGHCALECGIRQLAASRDWALWAVDRLQKSEEARTETARTPTAEL